MLVVFVSLEYHTAYIPGGRLRRQAPSGAQPILTRRCRQTRKRAAERHSVMLTFL